MTPPPSLLLAFWRKQRAMTQAELAGLVGRSRAQIQRYETGTASPTLMTAFRIAAALEVDPRTLFEDTWRDAIQAVATRRHQDPGTDVHNWASQ